MPVFYPIIKKVIEGGGSMEGFHMVRFFNDDQTTLLYTVFVPTGASAMYAGETPEPTVDIGGIFAGFEPVPVNVTADFDCYAVYDDIGTLDQTSWARIAEASANGEAQNYFAVGDTKMIHIEGTVGTLEVNGDFGVYILGFDHNEELEGKGIHFGTFKDIDGKDICLIDGAYKVDSTDGTKCFNASHWGESNYGGWAGCDMRYDILGSTDKAPSDYGSVPVEGRQGYNPSENCATNPVANTLMAALPADLRAVLKPMTKYTKNTEGVHAAPTESIDYLPLLAEFEVMGSQKVASNQEKTKQSLYEYFSAGNSRVKYNYNYGEGVSALQWFLRSPHMSYDTQFAIILENGISSNYYARTSRGLAPIFKV